MHIPGFALYAALLLKKRAFNGMMVQLGDLFDILLPLEPRIKFKPRSPASDL